MGLDQYAYAVMPHKENTDFKYIWSHEENPEAVVGIAQWRKHADLQGWMEQLWKQKMLDAGEDVVSLDWSSFNCQPVRVTFQDLANLEKAVGEKNLPHTTGFFFGQSHPEHTEEDASFIGAAREAIAQDMEIYYSSWW
jgi:hypothetical protein